jgi:hypothetical protein
MLQEFITIEDTIEVQHAVWTYLDELYRPCMSLMRIVQTHCFVMLMVNMSIVLTIIVCPTRLCWLQCRWSLVHCRCYHLLFQARCSYGNSAYSDFPACLGNSCTMEEVKKIFRSFVEECTLTSIAVAVARLLRSCHRAHHVL